MTSKAIRIAGGSAFWGDSSASLKQLISGTQLNYLMLEYLAEITMSLLARARAKAADRGGKSAEDTHDMFSKFDPGGWPFRGNAGRVGRRCRKRCAKLKNV